MLLTVAEAAAFLRLQPSTIRSWILKHRIPYVKLGSRVFLRRSDCEALIAASIVPTRHDAEGRFFANRKEFHQYTGARDGDQ
jgi:excisionase family DNA binding protein